MVAGKTFLTKICALMCLALSVLRRGSCLRRYHKRPALHGFQSSGRHYSDCRMSHILKSPYDKKNYREITLQNGITALLVSDMDQTSLRPLPLQKKQRVHRAKESTSGSEDATDGEIDSEDSFSGTDIDSPTTSETLEVSGLLTAPAREHCKKKEKKRGCNPRDAKCRRCGSRYLTMESTVDNQEMTSEEHGVEVVMAAAALCVGVGSFNDPEDIPGFAHFLEHMVFMGSKKYKKENAFDDYISKHGGESNAWTDAERTVFFFDIHKEYFHKALDMFSHFFISPLFLKTSVDREIMAVDNEFQMIKTSDSDRYHQLLGTLTLPGNPMSHFLCGSQETLKIIPEQKGIDLYGRLRDFYKRMYSAHYMTLVVQAPETLDDLQDVVYDMFESIPNNNMLPPSLTKYRDPFVPRNFHKLLKVVPVEDCQKLDICWPLPPLYKRFKVKPLDYLGVLIAHEGPGSIMSILRKKGLALSLLGGNSNSGFDQNQLWSGFNVSIILTDSGMERISEVIQTVFEYVNMMQKCGPQAWFYKELRDIENIKFRFRDECDPIDNVEQVVENMQLYPLEHYLTGRSLILSYDAQLIRECLSYMSPAQASITLWSKAFGSSGECNQVEPWFGTSYSVTEVPEEWSKAWQNLKPNPDLCLPETNPFIPSDFELLKVEGASELPVQVLDNEFGRMWYKKDNKFKMPKGFILLHMMTPVVSSSVVRATLCDLFICILEQQLLESLYAASLTGYEFSVEGQSTGLVIHTEGFSHKLPQVVELFVNHIAEFKVRQELFNAVKSQLKKSYYNEMIKTYDFAKILRRAVTEPTNQPMPDRYCATDSLTLDMLLEFHHHMMGALYIEGLITGNFTPQHASEIGEFVLKKLCRQPLSEQQMPQRRVLKLPKGDLQCRVRGVNRKDTNSCVVNFYQHGPCTMRDVCLNELLAARMKEPVFNKLRTELQLGYSVFCYSVITNGILGYAVVVEAHANKFSMSHIQEHISDFMENFKKTINKMTKKQFRELVMSVIVSKQVEDTQLGDETNRYWQEVLERNYIFDRQDREIETLMGISLSELKAWYQKYLDASHSHVSFQVEGCSQVPMEVDEEEPNSVDGKDFLKLLSPGEDFIKDLDQFRRSLKFFPVSKITS